MIKKLLSRYTVEVTEEDIKKGRRNNGSYCPVARAIQRITQKRNVYVLGNTKIYIGSVSYLAPLKVSKFIFNFDFGDPVKPFKFVLKRY